MNVLGITDTSEARPTNVGAIGEMLHEVFDSGELLKERRSVDAGPEGGGGDGRSHDGRMR